MSNTNNHHIEANAVQRVASLPLFDSALKSVVSVYTDVKGRYPLLGVVGGVAEIGVRNVSQAAILRATPLLLSLEPQIEVVNNYACMGLDQMENNFPVLHQSTEEVLGHLKDAFFLTLDDVQLRVNDELDGMQGRWDKLTNATWYYLLALQESQLGQMATSGLDNILTRLEEAMAKYMPLTATLRLEWERRIQQYEDEDGEDEPGLWTRFRGLLLCLSLQLYHRLLKLRNRLERAMGMVQDATDRMGLSRLLEVVGSVLQMLQLFYVSQVLRLEAVRRLALDQLKAQVRVLAELGPINQLLGLPAQVQLVVADLQELGKILLQLLVNSTPLYNMLQQSSDQDVVDFLNQQESMSSTRLSSASSLFLKAMDGRPHKRKSSYARSQRGSTSAPSPASAKSPNGSRGSQKQDDQTLSLELKNLDLPSTIAVCRRSSVHRCSSSDINPPDPSPVPNPAPANPANDDDQPLSCQGSQKPDDQPLSRQGSQKPDDQPLSRRGSQKQEDQPVFVELDSTVCRRSSAIEFLFAPIIQYLSPEPLSDETVIPEVETAKFHPDTRDESLPRCQSLSARSHWSSSSAVASKVETTEDLSPEQVSDEAKTLEVESTEHYSDVDARDESPSRRKSLSSSSHWSLSSAVAPAVETTEDLSPEQGSDEAIALEVGGIEYYSDTRDMSPPRRKSLSAQSHRSSSSAVAPEVETAEDLSPEQVSDESIALEVESTEYYSDARNEGPSRRKSLSAHSQRSSSSAGNPDDQPLSRRGSQKQHNQPFSLELDPLELHSTSTVRCPSSAAEVLLGSILQYLSSEPPSDKTIIPEVESTENHTEAKDKSPSSRKSLSARSRRSSSSAGNPDDQPLSRWGSQTPDDQPLSRRGNQKPDDQPLSLELDPLELPCTSTVRRPSSAAEVLLGSVLQYIRSEPSSDEPVVPEVEATENHIKARDESLPRRKSLSSSSHWSLSSAVAPVVETTEDLSPEQGSDEAIALEGGGIEYYSDTRDMSPPRRKTLSAHSQRSSSSAGNPDDQPLSRRGSQKQHNQPFSLELDPLELHSTSTVRCPSSAAEVLLGSILQYLSSEPPSDKTIIPEVESTENHTEAKDKSPSSRKSLSARSRRSSSSAGNSDDQPLSRRGSQTPDDQPLSRRGNQKPDDQPLSLELDPLELPCTSTVRRPSSAAEVLLGSVLQYIRSEPSSDEPIVPEVETTENHIKARDESSPRRKSLSACSHWSSSSAVAPEVETAEDLSPEKVSDEAVALEVESTEYYSDARDVSPSRRKSLSAGSHRSSSSAGNPGDQPLSRRGSQKPDDQPLSLELDPREHPSTSTMLRPSSAAEVLLSSILQNISSEPPSNEPVVPEVVTTENHTEARDESPPRCKSMSVHSRRSSTSAGNPSNVCQGSQMRNDQPLSVEFDVLEVSSSSALRRRSFAAEVLLGPILQYLSSEPPSDETIISKVETTENHTEARDESPPRHKGLFARSRYSSTSDVAPEVETTEDQSPEKVSDEAVALEVESTEYYSDARDVSPSRRNSLSAGSHRSSSSASNPDDQPLSRRGSQKPDDQPLSRRGSKNPDDQPLSLELDPLELPSTSTVHRPSSSAEVLLGSILQYISSEPPSDEPVVPEVETTENHTEARDKSPPTCKSLSVLSRRSSSSAGNPSNVRQGSQMRNDQPLSVEFDLLEVSSTSALRRQSLVAEVLLGPILQYLSSEPSSDKTVIPEVETTEKNAHARDESPPRCQSLSPRSHRSSSSAVVPEVETTEFYSGEGDGTPLRRKSLSIRSRRSSSSGGNAPAPGLTPGNTHNGLLCRKMQDSLEELDTLALPSTSAVRRRSWAVEVLLDPILQYLNPGHSGHDIEEAEIPRVEATEH